MGIPTRHTVSGAIDKNTPEHYLTHPVFGRYLEVVDEDAKPFVPVLHKPTTVKDKAPVETPKTVEVDTAPIKTVSSSNKNGKD